MGVCFAPPSLSLAIASVKMESLALNLSSALQTGQNSGGMVNSTCPHTSQTWIFDDVGRTLSLAAALAAVPETRRTAPVVSALTKSLRPTRFLTSRILTATTHEHPPRAGLYRINDGQTIAGAKGVTFVAHGGHESSAQPVSNIRGTVGK